MNFIERQAGGDRALLLDIRWQGMHDASKMEEFHQLALAAGVFVLDHLVVSRQVADPRFLIGSGKVNALCEKVQALSVDLILVNHPLTPSQERNLEKMCQCRVVDRTGLILDIFAQRAKTHEGKLQVELAQLRHMTTRLVRGWTHLERQKGGVGLRGPGETQLETDRRLVGIRIKTLSRKLDKVALNRAQNRRRRQRTALPLVACVGYTNAGKSTLFNRLTSANVLVKDQLFATLDPTLRAMQLPAVGQVVLADTVGFVRELPHALIAAFRATLEETVQADLLLHIVDACHPEREELIHSVDAVLQQIGADRRPTLMVYNKIDGQSELAPRIDYKEGQPWRVWCSALNGDGLDAVCESITHLLADQFTMHTIVVDVAHASQLRARLYEIEVVESEMVQPSGALQFEIKVSQQVFLELIDSPGVTVLSSNDTHS